MTLTEAFQILYTVGQLLDIIGAIVLIEPFTLKSPVTYLYTRDELNKIMKDEQEKKKRLKRKYYIGFGLIVLGFVFQFIQSLYNVWLNW